MKRMIAMLRTLFDFSFWREFIVIDIHDESRIMHEDE